MARIRVLELIAFASITAMAWNVDGADEMPEEAEPTPVRSGAPAFPHWEECSSGQTVAGFRAGRSSSTFIRTTVACWIPGTDGTTVVRWKNAKRPCCTSSVENASLPTEAGL